MAVGELISWADHQDGVSPNGPYHLYCTPLQTDRELAAAINQTTTDGGSDNAGAERSLHIKHQQETKTRNGRKSVDALEFSYLFKRELQNEDRTLTLCLASVSGALLVLALCLDDLPYDYYNFLRFVVAGTFAYFAKQLWESPERINRYLFLTVCLIYNPIIPLHLSRDIWNIINGATIFLLVFAQHLKPFYGREAKRREA